MGGGGAVASPLATLLIQWEAVSMATSLTTDRTAWSYAQVVPNSQTYWFILTQIT